MRDNLRDASLTWLLLALASGIAWAQTKPQTLVINGVSGQAAVAQIEGRAYVDVAALAHIANASLSFQPNRIVLTLPSSAANAPVALPPAEHVDNSALTRDFMKAGIEEIALMREWASPLAYAIQNGLPITEEWVADYRASAAQGLSMASVAAATDADRNAFQLLSNEFDAVREWSNKLVEARKSMDTAKYSISSGALREDPLSQKIIACGHFLASMLGSGSFQDNPSCH